MKKRRQKKILAGFAIGLYDDEDRNSRWQETVITADTLEDLLKEVKGHRGFVGIAEYIEVPLDVVKQICPKVMEEVPSWWRETVRLRVQQVRVIART